MTREDKETIISGLVEKIAAYPNFYITDTSDLTSEKTSKLRRLCFNHKVELKVAKNTLIQKALERSGHDYSPLFDSLKGVSAIMFCEVANAPAKLIKDFRKEGPRPLLKGASIEKAFFIGDTELDNLANLKSKNELIGEIIGLLQSPAKNVVSALQSGKSKLAGIVKTLGDRPEKA